MSLPWAELHRPCQGARLSNLLQIVLCGFCSLKAFCPALEDENENGSLPVSSPGAGSLGPYSSVLPQRKAVNHSCLPGLYLHSVLTQPVTDRLYLRHTTQFQVSKPFRLLRCAPMLLLLGEDGSWGIGDSAAAGPLLRQQSPTAPCFVVYGNAKL